MSDKKIYEKARVEITEISPSTLLVSSSAVPTVPVAISQAEVEVEDFQAGFMNDGYDFKDVTFE